MRQIVVAALLTILAAPTLACATSDTPGSAKAAADDSAKNVRDRDGETVTPVDQTKGSDADVEMTRQIRKAIVTHESLSLGARNVKIITLDGTVTLRGPVKSQTEKTTIAQIAADQAGGVAKVDDQLEVAR
jgi:osmotically-inducible protein OsmY